MNIVAMAELDRRLGIPGVAKVVEGNGGLAKVVVTTRETSGEVYLHGAHVTSWQPSGAEEVIFVSAKSWWQPGRPIRGGIPICFPWFANRADDPSAPAHGFLRTTAWQLESIKQMGDAVRVSLSAQSDDATKQWWLADFQAYYHVTFGSELIVELAVINCGTTSLRFEEALHTYFKVGQIQQVQIDGLDAVSYLDKTDSKRKKTQDGPIVIVFETDRVYLNTAGPVEFEDRALRRRVNIAKDNSLTTVVWNPWIDKAKAMPDFGDDEWPEMLCVETCNVADFAIELEAGEQHTMRAVYTLADW
jgi:glucose-6-phosphate 1-epimerase